MRTTIGLVLIGVLATACGPPMTDLATCDEVAQETGTLLVEAIEVGAGALAREPDGADVAETMVSDLGVLAGPWDAITVIEAHTPADLEPARRRLDALGDHADQLECGPLGWANARVAEQLRAAAAAAEGGLTAADAITRDLLAAVHAALTVTEPGRGR